MSFPKLKEKHAELQAARKELFDVFQEAGPERDMDKVKSLNGDSQAKVDWIRQKNEEINDLKEEYEDLKAIATAADEASLYEEGAEPGADGPEPAAKKKTLGKAFIESVAYTAFKGGVGPSAHLDLDIRNTLFERTAGFPPESTRTGYIDYSPEPQLTVLDFVPQLPTRQSAVKFMRETTFDDSNVAEKAEGATYGEAAFELQEQTLPIEKVPAWVPVTDEQLEDEDMAQEYVESRLVYAVRKRLNTQILQGSGVTPFLEGTENVTGIQTQALGGDPIPDAIYKLLTKIMDDADNAGGDADPSVVFIRATKWQNVALLRTADGIYIWGHPSQTGPRTIWGVPVGLTNAVTATKAVAGDYRAHSYLAVKRGVDVQVSNSHADFFINGKQAIRADVRAAMVHLRPAAFGEVTGL